MCDLKYIWIKKTQNLLKLQIFLFFSEASEVCFVNIYIYMSGGSFPVSIYLIKVSNENTKTGCEICSKLTIKTV